MNKKTIEKRRLSEECWSLDYAFYKWLNKRLPIYLREASRIIDLEYYKFTIEGKELTQKEVIELMIKDTTELIRKDSCIWEEKHQKIADRVLDCWRAVAKAMWW